MDKPKVIPLIKAEEAVWETFCCDCRRFHKQECGYCDVDAFIGTLEEIAADETEVLLPDRPNSTVSSKEPRPNSTISSIEPRIEPRPKDERTD